MIFMTKRASPDSLYVPLISASSTGTQYIKTGIYFNANEASKYRMVGDVSFDNNSLSLLGCASYLSFYCGAMNGRLYYATAYADINTGVPYTAGTRVQFDLDNPNTSIKIYQNGTEIYSAATTIPAYSGSKELCLFGYTTTDAGSVNPNPMTIYSLKLYKDGILVRDFESRKIWSKVGMYDKVEKKFYSNDGTGNLIGGQ